MSGVFQAVSSTLSYPMNSFPTSQTQRGISLFTPLSLRRGVGGEAASGVFQAASSLDNQGRKRAYRTTFSAHKRKKRPRIAARPPSKSSI